MAPAVDLVVNVFERTWRDTLTPGFFERIRTDSRFPIARNVLVVNNVDDRTEVTQQAQALTDAGEIDEVLWVDERIDAALAATGLTRADLAGVPYFTDWALVAVTAAGSEWVLHWDPDVRLTEPHDWITPSIALMERDPRVLAAQPHWDQETLAPMTSEWSGDFALGPGFTDQVFLARRAELARPIYSQRSLSRLRFPVAHLAHIYEARIDAYMRHNGRLRAIYAPASYTHASAAYGASYPSITRLERLKQMRNIATIEAIRRSPWKPARLRYM